MTHGSIGGLWLSVCLSVAVAATGTPLAQAATLTDYYKTLMVVRKCELVLDDEAVAKLQAAIENKVTSIDASSDTLNVIFDELASEIGDDTALFCADFSDDALAILSQL